MGQTFEQIYTFPAPLNLYVKTKESGFAQIINCNHRNNFCGFLYPDGVEIGLKI
jgi:hypothetical protein